METSIHRQLKLAYATCEEATEVSFDTFRIDAINQAGELIEIQHAGLGAIKAKIRSLLDHKQKPKVRVVKPIVARKWIVTRDPQTSEVVRRRLSPKRGVAADVFMELVHFTQLFPHPRLTLELVLVDMEEDRIPKLKHRFRRKNYESLEQTLIALNETVQLRKSSDLWKILPTVRLPKTFDTAELGRQIDRPRWFAQKVAYCLKHSQAIEVVGKQGNSQIYRRVGRAA